ncbi:hypothetical protein SOVF_181530 isoform A, partial [Spinacia oleracea]
RDSQLANLTFRPSMAENDDAFSFGDFKSAPQTNGVTSTSKTDDVWADFFFNPLPPQSQYLPNNEFSNWAQPKSDPSSIRDDPFLNKSQKPTIGALPLSLFGEVEEEDGSNNISDNPQSHQNGNSKFNGFSLNFDGVASDLVVSSDNNMNDNDEDEDDEWEFKVAFSGNGIAEQGSLKERGGSVVSGSVIGTLAMMDREKQDASTSVDHRPGVISFVPPQSIDFFAASYGNGANHLSSEDVGIKSTASITNGFTWDPFPVVEYVGNISGISAISMNQDDDFDDFGDFIDASKEVVSEEQKQLGAHTNSTELQLPNGEVQEKQTQTGLSRGALPLSLFSDGTEESSDCLNLQNEVVHLPSLSPGNSFSGQGSAISINDLISNLYSQAQLTSSADSTVKPAENEEHSHPKVTVPIPLEVDEDWNDGSWEFKGAESENGVEEQLSTAVPVNIAQKESEILPELQTYTEFYDQLRGSLCFLLSCQLDELKKARNSDVENGNGGKAEALDDEIQEVSKLLEESVISKEVRSEKDLERSSCLNKFLEVLQGPKFNVIEADFSLSKRLQLAANEWKVAAELLRHAISMLKILSLGSSDEKSLYASTWSKIINVCDQELRHGASIWKRATEKNVQHQILSDSRGQQFIQALGEIYRVVELVGLSAKVYRPWILLNVLDPSQFLSALVECGALWVNSGLEESLQNLSDGVDFQCNETAKALVISIKNICDIDVVTVHDRLLLEHKSVCRLSLLPQDMMDLKMVTWGEKAYFSNLANLWANLISSDSPQLPNLQVS